jgi:putative membrane protein
MTKRLPSTVPAIPERSKPAVRRYLLVLGVSLVAVLAWSGIGPRDAGAWWLEVMPVIVAVPSLVATFRRFPLTPLAYILIWLHAIILMIGGHYTYAEVPLFNWIRDTFHLSRNHYDRVGHFAQGFVPAILAREILLRTSPLRPGKWLFFLVSCVCLAISAFYELIEWWAALSTSPDTGTAFLGTQGDVWDTQWDMSLALVGSLFAQLSLGSLHDAQLNLAARPSPRSNCD